MTELVTATPAMLERFLGEPLKETARAVAAIDGDTVLGVAGLNIKAQALFLWSSMTDELRAHPRPILKGIRQLLAIAARRRLPVYAYADPLIDGSERLLEHFGFEHVEKRTYLWRAHG